MMHTISPPAQQVINEYQSIRIGNVSIPCLYYNNKRQQIRAGLRVSIGKGTPAEIEEEVRILAQREKLNLETIEEDTARTFLKTHNIGIDCSAFAYYVLDAEVYSKTSKRLRSILKFPYTTSPLRKLLTALRTVENTNVKTLAHEKNSTEIPLSQVRPGDMITILEGGRDHAWYHVMIIQAVDYADNGTPTTLHYVHSYQWPTDGQYGHGVRSGSITVTDINAPLLAQSWKERDTEGEKNETWKRASEAKQVRLRRLNILT